MVVTKVMPVTKIKYKVFVEDQFAFILYKGELSRYRIKEGQVLNEETYEELKKLIIKRAKLRAMHLLNAMSRTEEQLKSKLKQGGYTEDAIEEALSYVKSFGYIDDGHYARQFIESRKSSKSKKEIFAALCQKGLDKAVIETAMEDIYETEDAKEAIRKLLIRKKYDPALADSDEKKKVCGYLMRKGFSYEDIRQVIQVSFWDA